MMRREAKIIRYISSTLVISLSILFIGTSGNNAYATDATLTISLSSSNVTANVAPFADTTGTFVQSSPITVGVTTDNYTGYTLGIKANDNTYPERLINATDSSYLSSINSATSLASFKATDLSSITTSGGNQGIWGYLPSKLNSVANTDFLPSPGTAGNTIDETSSANSTAINYTIALGAKVTPLATLGAYTNAFTITAVANPIPYTIIYAENTVTGMPDNVISGSSDGATVTISSTTPTRDGYVFLGWCDQATTNTNGTDTCASGHEHQPGGTVTLDATANANNIKLYAMWGPPKTIATASTMQEVEECPSTLTTGQVYTIKDSRDNKDYRVAKLADGKCWMLDNLRLDLVANKNNLNASNTNASNTTLDYLKNGGGSGQYAATAVAYAGSSDTYDTPQVAVSGTCYDAYCVDSPSSGNWTSDAVTSTTISGTTSIAQGKIGAYYNYCAASAGSYCYDSSGGTGNASEDICPAGWRLPTGGDGGEFNSLYSQYSGGSPSQVVAFQTAFQTPLSGSFYTGAARYQGYSGFFWSSTCNRGYNMYGLSVRSSDVTPSNYDFRSHDYHIRCVLSS